MPECKLENVRAFVIDLAVGNLLDGICTHIFSYFCNHSEEVTLCQNWLVGVKAQRGEFLSV